MSNALVYNAYTNGVKTVKKQAYKNTQNINTKIESRKTYTIPIRNDSEKVVNL